ncbi:HDOD domain-containing protein [Beggiatoa alba]|nr:HDOD domain-containing protein [Beggiatoa alba]
MSWTPERIVKETLSLSSLPTVYYQLVEAIENSASSNRDIERILHSDSGLVARLLRITNSALYAFPSKIDTIGVAITVIGTAQLRELTLATSVLKIFDGISSELVNMQSFWTHSIACGICARTLAGYRREPNTERLFVAGLLHDIGRVLMFSKIPQQASEALQRAAKTGELLFKVEREIIGFDHAAVGYALLQQWKLPAPIVNAVRYHHRPSMNNLNSDAAIVHLADIITNALQLGSSGEKQVPALDNKAWEQLDLSPSILAPTIKQLTQQCDETVRAMLRQDT